ncbi:hypothetical protein SHT67_14335 (plasmid) [Enterococcus faecalis]|uniref:hypothetical protein n=1 Tax=Enterococcus faecalis TaxID=1351 RepID=UPI0029C7A1F5|nr:hypothetical protein [Enterococcus faecalis]WPH48353.1 hypothetical protein SHT67_14335 [Enterococcus faecalis]
MQIEEQPQQETKTLAVKKADLRFQYNGTGNLSYLAIKPNKLIELHLNGLLEDSLIREYQEILIIYGQRQVNIPVVAGSYEFIGKGTRLLRFKVSPKCRISKAEVNNWYSKYNLM